MQKCPSALDLPNYVCSEGQESAERQHQQQVARTTSQACTSPKLQPCIHLYPSIAQDGDNMQIQRADRRRLQMQHLAQSCLRYNVSSLKACTGGGPTCIMQWVKRGPNAEC